MESQPQNPEFRNNPENFHPCIYSNYLDRYQLTLCILMDSSLCFDTINLEWCIVHT